MTPLERKTVAQDIAISTLRLRDDAFRLAAEARKCGDAKASRAFEREAEKVGKLIADYGLDRYAHRP